MKSRPLVAAYGHLFPSLDLETEILGRSGIDLFDANDLHNTEIANAEVEGVLLGAFKKLDRERLKRLRKCKAIVRYGIGVDNVDLEAATKAGIAVSNVPDYCIEEVAVHALACALSLIRGLSYWDASVRTGSWRGKSLPKLRRPSTCRLGIVGFGQIGRILESRARAIFASIAVHDPWYKPSPCDAPGPRTSFVSLDELLETSDVISVHVPLTSDTAGMLGEAALRKTKNGAFVVNASRGGIVDEKALLEAVGSGRLGGAALDTFTKEPLPGDDPLAGEKRILLSPHIAWKSEEAEIELRRGAAEEIARILTGRAARSQVNRSFA
jgi:D-3-phosphoglycerate dehydrogenase